MKFLVVLLFILYPINSNAQFFGSKIPSTTYYVNQLIGSDSNNGTTVTTPFLTIAKLLTVMTCSQSVTIFGGYDSQIVYKEQFTGSICTDSNQQTITGYGNYQPLLDASELITVGQWSKTAGRTNIYQADLVFDLNGFARIWEDSTSLLNKSSLATLDSEVGYYFANEPLGPSTITIYIHATGDGNPASNGKIYEYNKRGLGVFSQSRMVVSNVATRRNLSNNGSLQVGPWSFITSTTSNDGTKHNTLIQRNTVIRYCNLNDSYYPGQSKIALVLNDNSPTSNDNAWIESCNYTETVEPGGVGFYGHVNINGNYGTVICKNCSTGVGVTSAIGGFTSDYMVITGGNFTTGRITAGSSLGNLIEYTTLNSNIGLPYVVPVEISNVIISCNCISGVITLADNAALNIHDSNLTNTREFDGSIYFTTGITYTSFTSLNNIFNAPVRTNHLIGPGTANITLSAIINGNTYHYPSGMSSWILYRGITYDISNLAQWNNWLELGFDSTGSRVTP